MSLQDHVLLSLPVAVTAGVVDEEELLLGLVVLKVSNDCMMTILLTRARHMQSRICCRSRTIDENDKQLTIS